MSVNKSCPIVFRLVDKHIIRVNAIIVFAFLLGFIFTGNPLMILVVLGDFIIRVFWGLKFSPICFFIKRALRLSGVKPHLINAGPKIFAAKIGLIFAVSILSATFFGFTFLATAIALIFIIAVGLEAFFNYCLACELYPYYNKYFG